MNRPDTHSERGFTLVEIMIVVAIIGILAGIAAPFYFDKIEESKAAQCLSNRKAIERTAIFHFTQNDLPPKATIPSVSEMVDLGYLDLVPRCPSGGIYVWAKKKYKNNRLPDLGCSVHYLPKKH